jgi:hypothetical protein
MSCFVVAIDFVVFAVVGSAIFSDKIGVGGPNGFQSINHNHNITVEGNLLNVIFT